MPRITPRNAVNVWAAGFGAAAIGQMAMNRRVAQNSRWGKSGWQREVIIWNLGTLTGLAALRLMPEDPDRALVVGFSTLSALFAANHVKAIVAEEGGGSTTHVEALAMNLAGLAVGAAALRPNSKK
jgi:hypothetical protein